MSRPTVNKAAGQGKKSSSMLMGILMGMIVGVALAAGLAWFILKSPTPFVNKESGGNSTVEILKPDLEVIRPAPSQPKVEIATSGVEDEKPRFEFYKVLTDKPEATADIQGKSGEKIKAVESKPSVSVKYVQAGAFSNPADAETLKANLVMKGLDATVQVVTIPDKGVMHRVRVGPFQTEQELNSARGTLKLNGLDYTPVH